MKISQILIAISFLGSTLFQQQVQANNEAHQQDSEATAHKGGHDPAHVAHEMSALFPQPKADLNQQERPGKPELSSPSFYESVSAGKVVLNWKESTGADAYHVQIATDANFKWLVSETVDLKSTSYEVPVESGRNYYWRVMGTKMSNVSQFTKSEFSSSMFRVK